MRTRSKKKNQKRKKKIIWIFIVALSVLGFSVFVFIKSGLLETTLIRRYDGHNFQCVAFVERYYLKTFGIKIEKVGNAKNMMALAPNYGLFAHENGGVIAPQPGDILVFEKAKIPGHVAIITDVKKEGVWVIEQNWGTREITTNHNKPLPMEFKDGGYFMPNRGSYRIMGWVSRTNASPGTEFDFENNFSGGWIADHHTVEVERPFTDTWSVKSTGRDSTIMSPVFINGLSAQEIGSVEIRMIILDPTNITEGTLFLRNKNEEWETDVLFGLADALGRFQTVSIPLDFLPEDERITQMRIKINNVPAVQKEIWAIDWIRFNPRITTVPTTPVIQPAEANQ